MKLIFKILLPALLYITTLPLVFAEDIETEIILYERIPVDTSMYLSARICKPAEMKQALPAILWFTPYIIDEQHEESKYFAQNGFVYVSVDVRGRGDSEGEFFPLEQDGADGAQVIDWIASQSWCNGKVAMMGGSYRGMVQWQTLKHYYPNKMNALKTIVPAASVGPGIDYPQPRNIFYSYSARWLAFVSGNTSLRNLFSDSKFWSQKFYKLYENYLPFSKLDSITGIPGKIFQRWISHPQRDNYWKNMVPANDDYKHFNIPILTITGHFDDDQPGAMHYYHSHMKYGTEQGIKNHYLLVGPWDHSGTRRPQKLLGGLNFPDNAVPDLNALHVEWFNWILKNGEKPKFIKDRVNYYVMGDNSWKHASKIEDVSNTTKKYFLSSPQSNADDVFNSGVLQQTAANDAQPDTFSYNPLTLIDKQDYLNPDPDYLTSEQAAFAQDKLIYHSAPLDEDLEVSGYMEFKAHIELNVADTDLKVNIYEITDLGKSIFIGEDMIRARYRNSLEKEELVVPGDINLYEFRTFYFFSRKIKKGSRLRLVLSSLNSPEYNKNYNRGGDVLNESGKDAKTAIIKLYHDINRPSVLILPVKTN